MQESGEIFPIRYAIDPITLNTIYRHYSNGVEEFNVYDKNNDRIHSVYSDGYEEYNTYNDKHQVVHRENNSVGTIDYEYDKYGNCIHEKYGNGYEIFNEFDENGNYIRTYDNYTEGE